MERLAQGTKVLESEGLDYNQVLERVKSTVNPVARLVAGDKGFPQIANQAWAEIILLSESADAEIVANAIAARLLETVEVLIDDEVEPCYKMNCNQFISFLNHVSSQLNISNACLRDPACNLTVH